MNKSKIYSSILRPQLHNRFRLVGFSGLRLSWFGLPQSLLGSLYLWGSHGDGDLDCVVGS